MDTNTAWKEMLKNWPPDVARRGVLVTSYEDQIPFDGFIVNDNLLLLERKTPDTSGARKVIMSFDSVVAIKLIDVVRSKSLPGLGFVGSLGKE
jgi:hypothetical protein